MTCALKAARTVPSASCSSGSVGHGRSFPRTSVTSANLSSLFALTARKSTPILILVDRRFQELIILGVGHVFLLARAFERYKHERQRPIGLSSARRATTLLASDGPPIADRQAAVFRRGYPGKRRLTITDLGGKPASRSAAINCSSRITSSPARLQRNGHLCADRRTSGLVW